jgi:hypothetical protein
MNSQNLPWSPTVAFAALMRGRPSSLRGVAAWGLVAASWAAAWPLWLVDCFRYEPSYRAYIAKSLFLLPFMAWAVYLRGANCRMEIIGYRDARSKN